MYRNPHVIRLGEHDRNSNDDGAHIDVNVSRTVLYPSHRVGVSYHDLALIELADDVSFRVSHKMLIMNIS